MPCNGNATRLKKNLPACNYLLRALELLDGEIEVAHMCPELSARTSDGEYSGGPVIRWMLSHHALLELATALHACGAFTGENGDKPSFTDLMRCLCRAFHITVNDIYVKRTQMFDRCTKQTPFLDKLAEAFGRVAEQRLR